LPEVSWLFFQGANERPYLNHTGRVSNAEKQPTGPGPTGCDENGPAAALLVGHVSIHEDREEARIQFLLERHKMGEEWPEN
jgi:hypothetical protein